MSDDPLIEKISTPRGEGRSMTSLPPDLVNQNNNAPPGTGSSWFGPLAPIHPVAGPQVAARTWDFVPGYNLSTRPRAYEEIGFAELRALADAFDPVRIIIERRKDLLCRQDWAVRVKTENGKRPTQLSPAMRGLIKDVTDFLRHPTAEHSYRTWLRAVVEDLLVIDAPALYAERDHAGNLEELVPIDGATVKLILSNMGRRPKPFLYDGQPFDWLGQTVTPDNMGELGFRIVDQMVFPPIATRILKGLPAANMSVWDLYYQPLNVRTNHAYGFSPVQQIVTTVSIAMRRAMGQLEYYKEGNQPDAFYSLPETWTPDKVQQFQDYFDNLYSGNLANRRKLKFMPAGSTNPYHATREPPLKSEFDEYLLRICCAAFNFSPSAFVSLSNRSIAETHERQEDAGAEPLKQHIAELLCDVLEREFSDQLEFVWVEEDDTDPKVESEILTSYVAGGILSINEARSRLGEERNSDPAADRLMIKTQTGFVPIAGGDVAEEIDDEGDAIKLQKGAIVMLPPRGSKPRRFSIDRTTFTPNSKGELIVYSDADAAALQAEGWSRKSTSNRRSIQ